MSVNFNPHIMINIKTLGTNVKRPNEKRNYCIYDENRVNFLVLNSPESLSYLENYLKNSNDENGILEALYALDKIADKMNKKSKNGAKALDGLYPVLSRFNDNNTPEIQVMLSGIYRKILVPDAFGPLCNMLYKQINHPVSKYFDPKEETGGAILEYIRTYGAGYIYTPSDTKKANINVSHTIGLA